MIFAVMLLNPELVALGVNGANLNSDDNEKPANTPVFGSGE